MNKPFSLKSPNQRNTKRNPGPFTHQDEGSFEFLNNSPLSRPIGKPLQRELNNNQSDSSVEFICETVLVPSTTIQSAYNHQGQQYLQNMSVSTPNQPTTQPDPYRASSLSPNRINQTPVRRFSASPVLEGHGHPSEEFEFASEEEYWTEYPNYPVEDLSSFLNRRSIDWDDEDNFDSLAAQQAQYANVLPYDDEFQSRNFADEELEREYDLEVELMEEQNIRDEQAARRAFAAQDKEVEEELYDNEESGDRSMLEDFDNIMELSNSGQMEGNTELLEAVRKFKYAESLNDTLESPSFFYELPHELNMEVPKKQRPIKTRRYVGEDDGIMEIVGYVGSTSIRSKN